MWKKTDLKVAGSDGEICFAPGSVQNMDGVRICSAHDSGKAFLLLETETKNSFFEAFEGEESGAGPKIVKCAPLNGANAKALRRYFPWTKPVPVLRKKCSFGCGDRLGCATSAHAELFKHFDAAPVFAQQSVRELTLTHRTFQSVIDDASFQVFQANYQGGFGADGDHLKSFEHIGQALEAGVTMLTLDLSEQLKPGFADADESEVKAAYSALPSDLRARLERDYTDVPELGLHFTETERMRCALIYMKAMDFSAQVHEFLVSHGGADTDLEISIDETSAPTVPEHHYFVASELKYRKVPFVSLAPRFIGEFQKGIDYIGDLAEFERQFAVHAKIADHFGTYKISVHSGSDKFSAFPIIGRLTNGHFHLKTAGTSWLEAVHAIALADPVLFRKMLKTAFAGLNDALKLYHITADFSVLPDPDKITPEEMPALLDADCIPGRQLLHITYGAMLGGSDAALTEGIRHFLLAHADGYAECIAAHFTKHLKLLGIAGK